MEVAERNTPQNGAPGKPRELAASPGNPPDRPGHLGERTTLLRFGRRCAALRRNWPASHRRGAQHGDLSAAELAACTTRPWTLMEVYGGQTHAILRWGLAQLLPPGVRLIHGPGCPVCVTPAATVDAALALARRPGVILCSYGDMLRVPGSTATSLLALRAEGANVRLLTSPLQALAASLDAERRFPRPGAFGSAAEITVSPGPGSLASPRGGIASPIPVADPASASGPCIAAAILRGQASPLQCPAFGQGCTPEHPLGAPMVSS